MRIAPLLLPDIRELLQANPEEIREALAEIHPADLAELFRRFSDEERVQFYEILPPDLQVEVFEHLDHEMQTRLLTLLSNQSASHIVNEMASDDRADFIGSLSPEEQRPVFDLLSEEEKEDVDLLLRYPESTAGGLMTTTFVALPEGMTVAEAIAHIRKVAEASETIYYVYVVDADGRLEGVLSLKDLVLSPDDRPIREVMNREVISAHVLDDQEAVSQTMARYDFL
ncbi:MAG: magnesium transporter, partial [Deltaproteobacteria bacterium]